MRAFEISVNGEKLCVSGLEEGQLLFSLAYTENTNGCGEVGLSVTGTSYLKEEVVRWQQRALRMNDVVQVKIIDAQAVDEPEVLQKGFPK